MSHGVDDGQVASPCTSVCRIDPANGLCVGCFRTLDEIACWIDLGTDARREVLASLAGRRTLYGTMIAARRACDGQR